jgi:GT2 family glycosyltransferase
MSRAPRQNVAHVTVCLVLLFAFAYAGHAVAMASSAAMFGRERLAIVLGETVLELLAGAFGIASAVSAVTFLFMRDTREQSNPPASLEPPPIGIVYLCCDDADWTALESLTLLSYRGPLHVVIHDDSRDEDARLGVDRMAARLGVARPWSVRVLRRPDKSGGKAGAVNYVLDHTAHEYDFFLLCDNDSTILDPDTLQRALCHMASPRGAGVQFRSVAVPDPGYCRVNRRLAESIGAFHAFLAPAARFGWMPFIGHNALLRTAAVRHVGGLTPDFFSDDLDLTVRLNLAGGRIVYAPEIEMGEKHPPSYTAFRKRSYKWAYGCVQTLRAHWSAVLGSPAFSFAEKLSFMHFAGFYCVQSILLLYLCVVLLVAPFAPPGTALADPKAGFLVGSALLGMVYAPLLAFYLRSRAHRRPGWLWTVVLCGVVYGGADFSVFGGVIDAFRGRRRAWIPTNGVLATATDPTLFAEAFFGLMLLSVLTIYLPELLYLPCWLLFGGKFLFGPALSLLYRDEPHHALVTFDHARDPERAGVVEPDRCSGREQVVAS